jgi:hypothetical protein
MDKATAIALFQKNKQKRPEGCAEWHTCGAQEDTRAYVRVNRTRGSSPLLIHWREFYECPSPDFSNVTRTTHEDEVDSCTAGASATAAATTAATATAAASPLPYAQEVKKLHWLNKVSKQTGSSTVNCQHHSSCHADETGQPARQLGVYKFRLK